MFDVVTFGSACLDVFVFYTKTVLSNKKNLKGVFLPLDEKLEGSDVLLNIDTTSQAGSAIWQSVESIVFDTASLIGAPKKIILSFNKRE